MGTNRWAMAVLGGATIGALAVGIVAVADHGPGPASGARPAARTAAQTGPDSTDPTQTTSGNGVVARTVTVQGQGTIKAKPDTATINLGVQAEAPTATGALDIANTKAKVLIDTLKASGIADDDIVTTGVSLSPRYDNQGRTIVGYQAANTVMATVRKIDTTGAVLDAAAHLVGDQITIAGVSFGIGDTSALEDQARAKAIDDARHRAETYAKAAGVGVGDVVQISEVTVQVPQPYVYAAEDKSAAGAAVPLQPGTQEITLSVTVAFALTSGG